jgi:hypothetical protein
MNRVPLNWLGGASTWSNSLGAKAAFDRISLVEAFSEFTEGALLFPGETRTDFLSEGEDRLTLDFVRLVDMATPIEIAQNSDS